MRLNGMCDHQNTASAASKRPSLVRNQLADAGLGQREELVELRAGEGLALGSALHLDEVTGAGHDDVHVAAAGRVLRVVEVKHRRALVNANGYGAHEIPYGLLLQQFLLLQPRNGVVQGDEGAGDGRGARAAVGLQNVAIQMYGSLPERREVGDRAERASYQ